MFRGLWTWVFGESILCDSSIDKNIPHPRYKYHMDVTGQTIQTTSVFTLKVNENGWDVQRGVIGMDALFESGEMKYDPTMHYIIRNVSVTHYDNPSNVAIPIEFKLYHYDHVRGTMLDSNDSVDTSTPKYSYTLLPRSRSRIPDDMAIILSSKYVQKGFLESMAPLRELLLNSDQFKTANSKCAIIPVDHAFYFVLFKWRKQIEGALGVKLSIIACTEEGTHLQPGSVSQAAKYVTIDMASVQNIQKHLEDRYYSHWKILDVTNSTISMSRKSLPDLTDELRIRFKECSDRYNSLNPSNKENFVNISVGLSINILMYPINQSRKTTYYGSNILVSPSDMLKFIQTPPTLSEFTPLLDTNQSTVHQPKNNDVHTVLPIIFKESKDGDEK